MNDPCAVDIEEHIRKLRALVQKLADEVTTLRCQNRRLTNENNEQLDTIFELQRTIQRLTQPLCMDHD